MRGKTKISRRGLLGAGVAAVIGTSLLRVSRTEAAEKGFPVRYSDTEWRRRLSQQQYAVLRREGTERAGTSPLNREKRRGVYSCAGCGQRLFSSTTKFESGTGWPSFWRPLPGAVGTSTDHKIGYARTEVHCSRCGGHLGHVFPDGPRPTGLRYCMNGVALVFGT